MRGSRASVVGQAWAYTPAAVVASTGSLHARSNCPCSTPRARNAAASSVTVQPQQVAITLTDDSAMRRKLVGGPVARWNAMAGFCVHMPRTPAAQRTGARLGCTQPSSAERARPICGLERRRPPGRCQLSVLHTSPDCRDANPPLRGSSMAVPASASGRHASAVQCFGPARKPRHAALRMHGVPARDPRFCAQWLVRQGSMPRNDARFTASSGGCTYVSDPTLCRHCPLRLPRPQPHHNTRAKSGPRSTGAASTHSMGGWRSEDQARKVESPIAWICRSWRLKGRFRCRCCAS